MRPLKNGTGRDELLQQLQLIQFTNDKTNISDAFELAIAELDANGRKEANKVLLLKASKQLILY